MSIDDRCFYLLLYVFYFVLWSTSNDTGSSDNSSHSSRFGRRRGEPSYHEKEGGNRSSNRSHYNYILREAEEQYKAGVVPISTYNRVVTEVSTYFMLIFTILS